MKPTQVARRLKTTLDTKNCTLRRGEIEAMEESLGGLEAVAASFPFADLQVTISYAARSDEYHIKTTLKLPGATLFTGEHDSVVLPAYDRCVRKLVRKVEDYKERMGSNNGAKAKFVEGTRQAVVATEAPDLERLGAAFGNQDYQAFREELSGFEDPIRRRVGRWVQRYPELDETFGEYLPMDDLVEEVMLTAFEEYETRPEVLRIGDWLEGLIDPALRSFLRHPEEELEAISYARTLREMREGRPAAPRVAAADRNPPAEPGRGKTDPEGSAAGNGSSASGSSAVGAAGNGRARKPR